MSKPQGNNRRQKPKKEKPEFDQSIVDLARVTRVTKGGKHLSFRALVLIGDRKGRVGYGVEKGA
ncbi:MAG: 30S ribosomal protein S5, partial [uncultured bacterium]